MRLRKIKRSTLPIEVSQDFFDDDDFDGPTAFFSLYGADRDNNGKDWEYYMRL